MKELKIGTRASPLALWQANFIRSEIEKKHPGVEVKIFHIHTQGDKILDVPLAKVGGKGLFVKEIENELLAGNIDLAVHSMKDVPTALPDPLEISVICDREDPRDAFLAREARSVADLPQGAKVGTSSLRRQAQLLGLRPDLNVVSLRGNVGTRVRKMTEENMDAIILAVSGLLRMEMDNLITARLSEEDFVPAVAQGALGIETRKDDSATRAMIDFLNHPPTAQRVAAERAFLARLEGGCQVPIAGHATLVDGRLKLDGLVGSVDGKIIFRDKTEGDPADGPALGRALAEKLLDMGAAKVLAEVYGAQ
ncbi:MAG: hydroxymethylbilane synthase [Nitrospinota bacterium]|nr:hydroxymethylbilane synthase [Nitrospinota bacterium]MDH5757296.1 hydroxymethylbilane synthase [Nitrospinota bacterium]